MSLRAKLVLAASVTLIAAFSFGFGPVVRSAISRAAARRGLAVRVGSVWPGIGAVRLRRVRITSGAPGWLRADLAAVDVGFGLGIRSVDVRGGTVALEGEANDVIRRLRDLASRHAPGDHRDRSRGIGVHGSDLKVTWSGRAGADKPVVVDGVRFDRTDAGGQVAAARVTLSHRRSLAIASDAAAHFKRDAGKTRWSDMRVGKLEVDLATSDPANEADAPGADSPPASENSLKWRDRAIEVAEWVDQHTTPGAPCEIEGLTLLVRQGDQRLNVAPGSVQIKHDADALSIDLVPDGDRAAGGTPLTLHVSVPTKPGELSAHVQGGPVTLASLGVHENDFGLIDVGNATFEARGDITLSADAESVMFDGDGRLHSLCIVQKSLADEPVRGMELALRAAGAYALDGSSIRLDEAKVDLGALRIEGFGVIERAADHDRIDARFSVPLSDCQKIFESIPRALVPKVAGIAMSGSFSLKAGVAFDTSRPDQVKVDWDLANRCRITNAPPEIDVSRFFRPFKRTVLDPRGEKVEIVSGPGTPDWVPLSAISPYMEAAVTTTEDGAFRYHGGFDKGAIKSSIRDDLRAKRFIRGASTISMQVAKNLYLEREKSLSRKLQEAILTVYLEQELTKDQILELYFNIVELGPMIYGIGPAAEHYFDTTPSDLSLGQAVYLATLLPNPKKVYFGADGQVTKGWMSYVHRLMRIMRDRDKITDEELADGLSEVITYRVAKSPRVRGIDEAPGDVNAQEGWTAPDGP
jgi:Transglycosylase